MRRSEGPYIPPFIESQLPTDVERYFVDVGGWRMHVMEVGEGRPVLMLHGNPTWGFLYRKVATALRGEPLRLIMPDLIGLGFSDKPPDAGAHQLGEHSRWIGALIDQLDLSDLIFVGQDWGGPIGLHALASRPGRVAGMVLMNTVVGPPRAGFRPTAFHRFARVPVISDAVFRLGGFPQNVLTFVQGDRLSILGGVSRAYRYPLRKVDERVAPLALARMVPDTHEHPSIAPMTESQRFVESFAGPVALVWGERDPILGRALKWVQALMPDARVTRTQAGHFLQEEVPDDIAAAICWVAGQARST